MQMSTDLREQLRVAAGEPARGPDVTGAMRRGHKLRVRRRTAGVAAGTTMVVALVAVGSWLPGAISPPHIDLPPAGPPDDSQPADGPDQGWSELTRGTQSGGSTWVLAGKRTTDEVCIRWQIVGADSEHTNCGRDPGASDLLVIVSADPELVIGYAGPEIVAVEILLEDGTTLQADLHSIPDSGFHAYVADTGGRTWKDITGLDTNGDIRIRLPTAQTQG
jgi:hypothetical protein